MQRVTKKELLTRGNLDGITQIRLRDDTEYNYKLCRNGGCYGYWTDYERLKNNLFRVSYGTTSEFSYCPACGAWDYHDIGNGEFSCGDYQTITESELWEIIHNFEEDDYNYIEYIED